MVEWLSHCCTWPSPHVWASQARQDSDESVVEKALSLQGQSTQDSENMAAVSLELSALRWGCRGDAGRGRTHGAGPGRHVGLF